MAQVRRERDSDRLTWANYIRGPLGHFALVETKCTTNSRRRRPIFQGAEILLKQDWQDKNVRSVSPTETIAAAQPKNTSKLEWAATSSGGGGLAHSIHCTGVSLLVLLFFSIFLDLLSDRIIICCEERGQFLGL